VSRERKPQVNRRAESDVLLIGMGNPLRGDDAVGRIVARRLVRRSVPHLRIVEQDGDITRLMEAWSAAASVIVVDAISPGSQAGTIRRFDVTEQGLPGRVFQNSTHALGLHEAIELSRALQRLPKRLLIYGITGKSFALGGEVSVEVGQAAALLVERIIADVAALYESMPSS
jgi:hydrogenase maturation protease